MHLNHVLFITYNSRDGIHQILPYLGAYLIKIAIS